MLALFGVVLVLILLAAHVHHELRAALYGIELSNGVEVLVNKDTYRTIVSRYQAETEPDHRLRWDQAVLDILRPDRPNEWRFLVHSLGYRVTGKHHVAHRHSQRQRLTVRR